jgi:hypothetical protein
VGGEPTTVVSAVAEPVIWGAPMRWFVWPLLAGLGLATSPAWAGADARDGVRLSFVRTANAADCIAASELEREVVQRLGRDPFTGPARQWIEGAVVLEAGYYSVELFERDAQGKALGSRQLRAAAGDCHQLDEAIVLAIALIIDPSLPFAPPQAPNPASVAPVPEADGSDQPPPPSNVRAPSCAAPGKLGAERHAAARPPRAAAAHMTTDAVAVHGVLPGFAVGAEMVADLALDARGRYSARIGALYLPEVSQRVSAGELRYGLTSLEIGGCAGAPGQRFRWFGCAALGLGAVHVVVDRPVPLSPGDRRWFALRLEAGLAVKLAGPLWADARLFDWIAAQRWEFRVKTPDGSETVFAQSPVMPGLALGLGLRFD